MAASQEQLGSCCDTGSPDFGYGCCFNARKPFAAPLKLTLPKARGKSAEPAVDAMITIFCDFYQLSANKRHFSPKPML
jgi:hypothetical protein